MVTFITMLDLTFFDPIYTALFMKKFKPNKPSKFYLKFLKNSFFFDFHTVFSPSNAIAS